MVNKVKLIAICYYKEMRIASIVLTIVLLVFCFFANNMNLSMFSEAFVKILISGICLYINHVILLKINSKNIKWLETAVTFFVICMLISLILNIISFIFTTDMADIAVVLPLTILLYLRMFR